MRTNNCQEKNSLPPVLLSSAATQLTTSYSQRSNTSSINSASQPKGYFSSLWESITSVFTAIWQWLCCCCPSSSSNSPTSTSTQQQPTSTQAPASTPSPTPSATSAQPPAVSNAAAPTQQSPSSTVDPTTKELGFCADRLARGCFEGGEFTHTDEISDVAVWNGQVVHFKKTKVFAIENNSRYVGVIHFQAKGAGKAYSFTDISQIDRFVEDFNRQNPCQPDDEFKISIDFVQKQSGILRFYYASCQKDDPNQLLYMKLVEESFSSFDEQKISLLASEQERRKLTRKITQL
jgi:hypothetical protein